MTRIFSILFITAIVLGCEGTGNKSGFVQVDNSQFIVNGEPYEFVGTNFWYGAYLGQAGDRGDRERLKSELDLLKAHGVSNLRILGASEESVFENSLSPVFINEDGSYNLKLMEGLDYLLSEMSKRNMKAVIFLNNYWEWSGGMSIYNYWYGGGPIIDPADGDWDAFMKYSAQFYQNEEAQQAFRKYVKTLINRENTITGQVYFEDPTVMSWQLANEPRPGRGDMSADDLKAYIDWIDETAAFIKMLAPYQLVSSGSEGETGSLDRMDIFVDAHDTPNIDYLTFHMWAKNWGWINTSDMAGTYKQTVDNATRYIEEHVRIADSLHKPIVMEEFGFPRDEEKYSTSSPTVYRDKYYKMVFDFVEQYDALAGSNFWSWGGFGKAQNEDYWWGEDDPFTGDPPQEAQGLNSVFVSDSTTLIIIKEHANKLGVLK